MNSLTAAFALLCLSSFFMAAGEGQSFSKGQWDYYTHRTYKDPGRFAWLAAWSLKDHILNDPKEWDRKPQALLYRTSSDMGKRVVGNSVQLGLELALGQDSRYRPSGLSGRKARVWHALRYTFIATGKDGGGKPPWALMGGVVARSGISGSWHPHSISAPALAGGVADHMLFRVGDNLLEEFTPDLKEYGKRIWHKAFKRK